MRNDDKRYFPFQNAGHPFLGVKFSKISGGECPPETPTELGPPVLALRGTCLFSLKCPSTLRINETTGLVVHFMTTTSKKRLAQVPLGRLPHPVTVPWTALSSALVRVVNTASRPDNHDNVCTSAPHLYPSQATTLLSVVYSSSSPYRGVISCLNSHTTFRKLCGITIPRNTNLLIVHSSFLKRIYPGTEH